MMDMVDMDINSMLFGIAGLLVVIALILTIIELVRRKVEAKGQEKEMLDQIESIDTKALLGIERELKGIRSSLHTIELVYGIVIFFVILIGARMILRR